VECFEVGDQGVVDLWSEVALDAAHDLGFGQAFLGSPFDIGTGAGAEPHPDDNGQVQRLVGVAVAAAVQPVPAGLAGAGRDGGDSAQVGEGGLAAQPLGVLAGGDEQLAGVVVADREQLQEPGSGPTDEVASRWSARVSSASSS
jgi:hypothetical protein